MRTIYLISSGVPVELTPTKVLRSTPYTTRRVDRSTFVKYLRQVLKEFRNPAYAVSVNGDSKWVDIVGDTAMLTIFKTDDIVIIHLAILPKYTYP